MPSQVLARVYTATFLLTAAESFSLFAGDVYASTNSRYDFRISRDFMRTSTRRISTKVRVEIFLRAHFDRAKQIRACGYGVEVSKRNNISTHRYFYPFSGTFRIRAIRKNVTIAELPLAGKIMENLS